jgi:hypothetical protein
MEFKALIIPSAATRYGFSDRRSGGLMARSMMLPELALLLAAPSTITGHVIRPSRRWVLASRNRLQLRQQRPTDKLREFFHILIALALSEPYQRHDQLFRLGDLFVGPATPFAVCPLFGAAVWHTRAEFHGTCLLI